MGLEALNLSNIATFLVFKVVQAYGQVYIYYLPMYLYSEYQKSLGYVSLDFIHFYLQIILQFMRSYNR